MDGQAKLTWMAALAGHIPGWMSRELNPDTVIHLSTNRARRWLTSLIETNALTTMPDDHMMDNDDDDQPENITLSAAYCYWWMYS